MAIDPEEIELGTGVRPLRSRRRLALENRLTLMALAAGFPAMLLALILLWTASYSSQTRWTLTLVLVVVWLGFSSACAGK